MTNEEKAKEVAKEMVEWKDKQFYEEQNVLLNLLKILITAGGDTKIIEQLIDTLDNQTIIENLAGLLK